jgi:hypothetical protein
MLTHFSVHGKSYLASCPDDACTGNGGQKLCLVNVKWMTNQKLENLEVIGYDSVINECQLS